MISDQNTAAAEGQRHFGSVPGRVGRGRRNAALVKSTCEVAFTAPDN
ncbi:hypothetical protein ACWEQ8_35700 [Streptomyces noursei]